MTDAIKQAFDRLGPWVTSFNIQGGTYGGNFPAMADDRLRLHWNAFPDAKTILELGSLEGGHSFAMAQRPGVERVLGIEGRPSNIDRARYVQGLYGITNVEFVEENLEGDVLEKYGHFDVCFNVGLLYHLPEPWNLVDQIGRVADGLFLWTHYANDKDAKTTVNGLPGLYYREFGLADPLSGMSDQSFWPTMTGLKQMIAGAGLKRIEILRDEPAHPHGPAVIMAAYRS